MASDHGSELEALLREALAGREDGDAQRAALAGLSSRKLELFEARLRAVLAYRALPNPGRLDAERLAATIGMKQRGFFQLLRNARDHGPVVGLAPYQRRKLRPSVEREGMHPTAEAALIEMMAGGETRFGRVFAEVRARMEAADLTPPSHQTVRRRIAALGGSTAPRNLRIGRVLAIVQSGIETRRDGGDGLQRTVLTLLADVDSRIVLGVGVDASARDSLRGAAADCEARMVPSLSAAGMPFSSRIEAVHLELEPEVADLLAFDGTAAADTGFDGESYAASFRHQAGRIVGPSGTEETMPVRPAVLMNAARVWNADILAGRPPRSRRDVDDGTGLVAALHVALARLERALPLTG